MPKQFQDLSIDEQIAYASWVACIGNEVLEALHGAKRAYTAAEKVVLQEKAYEALYRYQTSTIEFWEASLPIAVIADPIIEEII